MMFIPVDVSDARIRIDFFTFFERGVLTTELLAHENHKSCKRTSPNSGHRDEFAESGKVCGARRYLSLYHQLRVDVIEVACGLDSVLAQTTKRLEGFVVAVLLHQPTRRFCKRRQHYIASEARLYGTWTEVDQ